MQTMSELKDIVLELYDIGAVKFGQFTLKSGIQSPVYFDLRLIVSYPSILARVSDMLWTMVSANSVKCHSVCGVPYTALPIATLISAKHNIPMLIRRKEAKAYGTKKLIEGVIVEGSSVLIVEDVITSGASVLETCSDLRKVKLSVTHAVVLLDREQGGRDNIDKEGVTLCSLITLSQLTQFLQSAGKLSQETVAMVHEFLSNNRQVEIFKRPNPAFLTYAERAQSSTNPLVKKLLSLMDSKQTNLAFSADVKTSQELIKLCNAVGPYICLLKTHVDIVSDFSSDTAQTVQQLAGKYKFLVMEDRKFADIGNMVQLQYSDKRLHLTSGWADLVTCHAVSGPGVIHGLMGVAPPGSGCVIVAEMSSSGSLTSGEYTKGAVSLAESQSDFVLGVISRNRVSYQPHLVHMTPGIQETNYASDGLGQLYLTPEKAIGELHTDIIIVGRGIYRALDPEAAARQYRDRGFTAYQQRLTERQ